MLCKGMRGSINFDFCLFRYKRTLYNEMFYKEILIDVIYDLILLFWWKSIVTSMEDEKENSIAEKILEILANENATVKDFSKKIGVKENIIRTTINRMKK